MAEVKAEVNLVYVAASCNRNSNVSDCREDGLVAFGSGRFVALWNSTDITSKGVYATLPGHKGDITSLKYARRSKPAELATYIVSGDNNGDVHIWQEEKTGKFSHVTSVHIHSGSVSSLSALDISDNHFLVITGGSDGSVVCWDLRDGKLALLEKIDLKGKIPLDLALTFLPQSQSVCMAVGGTENRIRLYCRGKDSSNFTAALSLDGHTDWIRSLSFITPIASGSKDKCNYDISPGEVLLASGSQDNYIRLWRIVRPSKQDSSQGTARKGGLDGLEELEESLGDATASTIDESEIRVKAHSFQVPSDAEFSCSSEAVLLGHDAWVTGLHWAPRLTQDEPIRLLSASADRSMILWEPSSSIPSSDSSSIWTNSHRFGEFSSATNLGFFGALWGKHAAYVLAHGWGGSWHVWRRHDEEDAWDPIVTTSGHSLDVRSLAWEPLGEYLISAGADMTTRLHAPWRRKGGDLSDVETWHELGRPQIHGYPMASVAFTGRLQFVSGADEKIIRVFDAPKVLHSTLTNLSKIERLGEVDSRPMAANVPPLGLSNRAIADTNEAATLPSPSNDVFEAVTAVDYNVAPHPPFEEQLLGSTLWPEIEKLYGHGYEIIALASAKKHPLIATACKATNSEYAAIRFYDTVNWKPACSILEGHALSITTLAFSSDDRCLLSVSRDRSWRVYEKSGATYVSVANSKPHARIIWDACWAADDSCFFTGSRDKSVKVWSTGGDWHQLATLKFEESVTSVAETIGPKFKVHLLAVGLENGQIHLQTASPTGLGVWASLRIIDSMLAHVLSITALSFCPKDTSEGGKNDVYRIASGSEDRSARIMDIMLHP